MKSKKVSVQFDINDHGCPIVTSPKRASATARFEEASQGQPRDQIIIEANREGLRTLAQWMIALADEDSHLDHQHFDNEVDFGLFRSQSDCELIIQRVDT